MKHLLISTALVASMGFGSAAFAQTVPDEGSGMGATGAVSGASLLDTLLADASALQISLANVSENLASIDGSIDIDLSRFDSSFSEDVLVGGSTGVAIIEPLNASIGELTTTVIGSLGDNTVDTTATLANVEALNQAMTQTSDALNAQFATSNLGLQQVYNLSSNLGSLDASVDIGMVGVNVDELASITTTAIGSLGTGAITSAVTNNATALTERLVGTN